MARLEDLKLPAAVRGMLPDGVITVVDVPWFRSEALERTYKAAGDAVANQLLYRHDEPVRDARQCHSDLPALHPVELSGNRRTHTACDFVDPKLPDKKGSWPTTTASA